MEGPEGLDTFCNYSHEEPVGGWMARPGLDYIHNIIYIYPGVSPPFVCNTTPALTQELRSISQSPILEATEAAHEVTTISVILPPCYNVY